MAPSLPGSPWHNNYLADEFNPADQDCRRDLRARGLDPTGIPGPDIDLIDPATIEYDPSDRHMIGTQYARIIDQAKADRAKGIPWPGPLIKQVDQNEDASQRLAAPQREARPGAPDYDELSNRATPRPRTQAPGPVFDPKPLNPWVNW